MTKEELIQNMVDILQGKGGYCLESELLKALQAIDKSISKIQMDNVITKYFGIFKRTNEISKNGEVVQESGVELASVVPMPESKTDNTIDKLPTGKVGLPENQNKNERK